MYDRSYFAGLNPSGPARSALRELSQEAEQRRSLLEGQGSENLPLHFGKDQVKSFEHRGTGGGQLDQRLAGVARIGTAGDQPARLKPAHGDG